MKNTINKKKIIVTIIIVVGLIVIFRISYLRSLSPYDCINNYAYKYEEYQYEPEEILTHDNSEAGYEIVFYKFYLNEYRCAFLQKNILGIYEIIRFCGGKLISDDTYRYSGFSYNYARYGIYWGLLTDDTVTKVYIDGKECQIRATPQEGLRIFWIIENGSTDIVNHEFVKV